MTDNFRIASNDEVFDLTLARAWLDARPDVFEDPRESDHYFIAGTPAFADFLLDRLLDEPPSYPRACEVHLSPTMIFLANENGAADCQRSAADFLAWLLSRYRLQIVVDGYERDLSESAGVKGVAGVYPSYALDEPIPWRDSLIGVGMFRELPHGRAAPSLVRVRRAVSGLEEETLAAYLSSGHVYRHAIDNSEDYFDEDVDLGPSHLLTDGTYVWPADLPYYLRTYHVALPRPFTIHVRNNDWKMPRRVDIEPLPRNIC